MQARWQVLRPTLAVTVALSVASCAGSGGPSRGALANHAGASEWPMHGRTAAETRFSPLDQINAANVGRLGLAWSFDTGMERGHEATPIMVDGTIYTTGSWSVVFAVDARTGKLLWTWDPEVDRDRGRLACCDVVNRGVAVEDGRVFVGVLDGRLVALDAETGRVLWERVTVDQQDAYTITGAPRVVGGRVIIGNGGAEYGVRGYVSAYAADDGELLWRTYTIPGNPSEPFESPALERAAQTWSGQWWTYGGGGTVWDGMAYDPELDLLYVGTGNGSPWNREIRSPEGGDNLYLSSILALRPATGELVWHYQTTPGETWDFTATQPLILADLEIEGETRKVIMQAPKNGFFYVIDRTNGEFISAEPYTKINWATGVDPETGRPIEVPEARYVTDPMYVQPGPLGGHNWHPMSYNPETGLVYIPAQVNNSAYSQPAGFEFQRGVWNTGRGSTRPAAGQSIEPRGYLLAWDPVAQEERWRVEYDDQWNGGTLTTAGNLVFQGTADWRFVAYRADTGEKLWEVETPTGVIGGPISYELDGTQYIAVMAGWGGVYGLRSGGRGSTGRLLVFRLDGTAELERSPGARLAGRPAPEPVTFEATDATIAQGEALYGRLCATCHGEAAVGGGVVPDLRYADPTIYDQLAAIVLEGARADRGMPAFADRLDAAGVDAIRAYVLSRRAEIAAP